VRLTYLGHSAFLLEDGDRSVAVDPFLTGNPKAARSAEEIAPQTILLTHAHGDHVGDTVAIARRTGATVIATFELGTYFAKQGIKTVPANHGGTVAFDGGTTKFVPAWHTSSYTDEFLAPGVPAGHVVRFGGKTVYFSGDTCLFGDMALIGEEGLDVAVIPIGDLYTMGPADAVKAARLLRAGLVIPCHYNTFQAIEQDANAFTAMVEAQTDSRGLPLAPGETYDL
jgi:L-ascorbate metabolism protein UlaG (beta-lactamase superfamily)